LSTSITIHKEQPYTVGDLWTNCAIVDGVIYDAKNCKELEIIRELSQHARCLSHEYLYSTGIIMTTNGLNVRLELVLNDEFLYVSVLYLYDKWFNLRKKEKSSYPSRIDTVLNGMQYRARIIFTP
jgi:hypothetical protein